MNIVIADDHQMIIDGLKALLTSEKDVNIVGEAVSGPGLLSLLAKGNQIDLVILDVNMPEVDGIETAREIVRLYPRIKILVLTMHNKVGFVEQLLNLGVSGYLLKNTGREELVHALKTIQSGKKYFSSEVTNLITEKLSASPGSKNQQLTKREIEILKLVALANTTGQIAEKLFVSPYTVETHRKHILSKLNLKNTAALVKYAIENGYTTLPPND